MKHIFTFGNRTTRAIAGAVAGLALITGTAAAANGYPRDLGAANVQGGGYWGIEATTTDNVIAGGYTYVRVTNQSCDSTSRTAIVFEAYLSANESGDGSYGAELQPVTLAAEALTRLPTFEGQAAMVPAGAGTHVSAYLQILPGGPDMRLCLGSAGA